MGFTTKMKAPPDAVTISYAGVVVEVDEDGFVEVPTAAVEELKCHGLELVAPPPAPAAVKGAKPDPKADPAKK